MRTTPFKSFALMVAFSALAAVATGRSLPLSADGGPVASQDRYAITVVVDSAASDAYLGQRADSFDATLRNDRVR